ncbi:MAG: hypothetical protein RR848_07265 [Oscillospiraceae bacterium]
MLILKSFAWAALHRGKRRRAAKTKKVKKWLAAMPLNKREDVIIMKKSTLIAWVAFFSAIAGALAAAYFYIQRREAELDEYEQLLFSEDFCDEAPEDEYIPTETDDETTETEE